MALLDEYDQTRESFGEMVKTMLLVTQCNPDRKQALRQAATAIYRTEWAVVRMFNLDRLFLSWLGSPTHLWLTTPLAVDHWLPATAMIGVEGMKADERRGAMAAREIRVARCREHLEAGWAHEDAVVFVASREEWVAAQGRQV